MCLTVALSPKLVELLDQRLAGGLGDARSDRQSRGDEARVVHLVAMVGEVGPSAEDVVADRLRERVPLRQARGLPSRPGGPLLRA